MRLKDPSLLRTQNLIGGQWRGDGTSEIRNPATGALLAKVPYGGAASRRRRRWRPQAPHKRAGRR